MSASENTERELCPENTVAGERGEHFFKRGAFADSPIRCIYCGTKKAGGAR
ncbi:MAG TPA: hypothetical protein VIP77_11650 [Jiangellaceae bacterium]